jgi:hypothetical protein
MVRPLVNFMVNAGFLFETHIRKCYMLTEHEYSPCAIWPACCVFDIISTHLKLISTLMYPSRQIHITPDDWTVLVDCI